MKIFRKLSYRNACIYQTATRWDLPPYRITIWLIDVILNFVYLLVELILGFVTAIWRGKPVDSNSHRLSSFAGKLALIFLGKFELQSCSQHFGKQVTNKISQNWVQATRNKTLAIAFKKKVKADIKVFWSSPILLESCNLFQIFVEYCRLIFTGINLSLYLQIRLVVRSI